jgi:hypothetical protein
MDYPMWKICRSGAGFQAARWVPVGLSDAKTLWTEDERGAFCAWLVQNAEAGDVIPGSGGCRKERFLIYPTNL